MTKANLASFKSELLESLQGSNPTPATPPSQVLSPTQGLAPAKNPQINLPVSPATQPVKTGNPLVDQYYANLASNQKVDAELTAMLNSA